MPDREKVIKGLDVCLKNIDQSVCPNDCPYLSDCSKYENRVVFQPLMRDALILLKEQKPVRCMECKYYQDKDKKYDFAMCSELDICVDSDFYCKYWNK